MTEETIKIRYSAFSNITFKGELDTGIPVTEWIRMSELTKDNVLAEELFNLVDFYVTNDPTES